ncbi:MAG TPA: NAD(P)-dependent oxidoreductase [Fimbriimonadaceae bacterium]|nr:NAD(P)-dependent oxidoreductase [Fimbriimonadaceae bacterium]
MSKKLGFVGLGVMGGPMAGHLAKAGNEVTVWNRTAAKAEPVREAGATVAGSLADLGAACDIVFLCVSRSEDVEACLDELTKHARPGTLFVDHSTIAPAVATKLHGVLREEGFRFVDAPITGGSMGAQKGQLTIFCGGAPEDVDEAIETMKPYTKRAARVGGPGAGQMMKMANQIAVGGALLGLCECLSFAKKAGLDVKQAHELIGSGAGGSWAFENYGPKILNADWSPGFTVKNQRKDFAYCREAAKQLDAAIPGTDLVDDLLGNVKDDWTTAALYDVMLRMGAGD